MLNVTHICKSVQRKLFEKESALLRKKPKVLDPQNKNKTTLSFQDISTRSVFVRMASGAKSKAFITGMPDLGKNDYFEASYGTDMSNRLRPEAGIKNISVEYKDIMGAIRYATIEWVAGSIVELEAYIPHFLTPGRSVLLDFGWSYKKDFSYGNLGTLWDDEKGAVNEKAIKNAISIIQEKGGDYEGMFGVVTNFSFDLQEDGTFNCTTKLVTMGSNIFSNNLKGDASDTLNLFYKKDKETGEKKIFNDSYENLLDTLRNLPAKIFYGPNSIFRVFSETLMKDLIQMKLESEGFIKASGAFSLGIQKPGEETKEIIGGSVEARAFTGKDIRAEFLNARGIQIWGKKVWSEKVGGRAIFRIFGKTSKTKWYQNPTTPQEYLWDEIDYWSTEEVQSPPSSEVTSAGKATASIKLFSDVTHNIIVSVSKDTGLKSIWLRMGWFEDNVINRYISFKSENTDEVILTLRSIESVLDDNGIPLTENKLAGTPAGALLIWGTPEGFLYLTDKGYSKEGFNTIEEAQAARIAYFKRPENSDIQMVKKSVSIKNNPYNKDDISGGFLHFPQHPTKFLLPGSMTDPKYLYEKLGNVPEQTNHNFNEHTALFEFMSNKELMPYAFTDENNENHGNFRNIYVRVDEIQKAFGVHGVDQHASTANVGEVNFIAAYNKLLYALSSNFHNYWDFEIIQSVHDTNNIKVIDKNNLPNKLDLSYSYPPTEPPSESDLENSTYNLYKFPSFKAESIVKRQTLTSKIPSAMGLTAMYNSNKLGGLPHKDTKMTEPSDVSMAAWYGIGKKANLENEQIQDKYLEGIQLSYRNENNFISNVGNPTGDGNEPLTVGGSKLNIQTLEPPKSFMMEVDILTTKVISWLKSVVPGEQEMSNEKIVSMGFSNLQTAGVQSKAKRTELIIDAVETTMGKQHLWADTPEGPKKLTKDEIIEMAIDNVELTTQDMELINQEHTVAFHGMGGTANHFSLQHPIKSMKTVRPYTFGDLDPGGIAVPFQNPRITSFVKFNLNKFVNANADFVVPVELSLEVDGIGGIIPGNIFHVDYILNKYRIPSTDPKNGPSTYFQVKGLEHKLDSSGWATTITGQLRINHLFEIIDTTAKAKRSPVESMAKVDAAEIANEDPLPPDTDSDQAPPAKISKKRKKKKKNPGGAGGFFSGDLTPEKLAQMDDSDEIIEEQQKKEEKKQKLENPPPPTTKRSQETKEGFPQGSATYKVGEELLWGNTRGKPDAIQFFTEAETGKAMGYMFVIPRTDVGVLTAWFNIRIFHNANIGKATTFQKAGFKYYDTGPTAPGPEIGDSILIPKVSVGHYHALSSSTEPNLYAGAIPTSRLTTHTAMQNVVE